MRLFVLCMVVGGVMLCNIMALAFDLFVKP